MVLHLNIKGYVPITTINQRWGMLDFVHFRHWGEGPISTNESSLSQGDHFAHKHLDMAPHHYY